MTDKQQLKQLVRNDFPHLLKIPTRWMDNDIYGHVNNVVYYSYFDTVINEYLIKQGGLDIHNDSVIGLAVETQCSFFSSLTFPESIEATLRIAHLGDSSVRYEIGLFQENRMNIAAFGYFVHVFVDRNKQKPVPIPDKIKTALGLLVGN